MKKHRWIAVLSAMIMALAFAGCQINSDNHEHSFSKDWTSNATDHWHAATCEHTKEVSDKAAHTFGDYVSNNDATTESDGTKTRKCSVCGYEDTVTDEGSKIVATPIFSIESGAVNSGTEVTITCSTEGAKIYYTTDGTEPTAASTEYTAAISVKEAVTLKAIAVKDGMNDSAVASVSYTIIPVGFVKVTGTTITGTEEWTPTSNVFVSGRTISIPDMYVCDHEVTRGEFKELMGTDPSTASAYDKDGNELTGDAVLNNPVNYVSWYDAIAYCNKLSLKENLTPCYSVSGVTDWENLDYSLIPTESDTNWDALTYNKEADGYRLPTEAEWEWLARGGENYTYAGSNTVDDVAWYDTNTNDTGTREVKTKQANGYGLYDMSGNVDEWCYDWLGTVSISSSTADTGASSGSYRVQRGGCWCSPDVYCRVYLRQCLVPYFRGRYDGFRVVRSSS